MCAIADCMMPPCVDSVRPPDQCCATCPNGKTNIIFKKQKTNKHSFGTLTHLRRMYSPILINWTSSFPIYGLLGGIF